MDGWGWGVSDPEEAVGFVACGNDHIPGGWGFCRMPQGHEGVCAPTLEFINARWHDKLINKIYQQRRQLRGLNKTIRLYRLLWVEAANARDHYKKGRAGPVPSFTPSIPPESCPPESCWWCRLRARGERWWRG